ncbi:hypothetical protein MUK42_34246 [Musa troglodytarum]|uniref:Uncharacterized protein n=1 Tax=Musa troglodytarum TaxID=320322 RepID=A0A9E7E823_9LILI|nr:hypothetical protein MUK42_34246 [Musa troglodytarum]
MILKTMDFQQRFCLIRRDLWSRAIRRGGRRSKELHMELYEELPGPITFIGSPALCFCCASSKASTLTAMGPRPEYDCIVINVTVDMTHLSRVKE